MYEILDLNAMKEDNILEHYGTPRHSGRYPWGSGKNPQRSRDFLSRYNHLKEQGLSEKQIAVQLLGKDASTTDLRAEKTIASAARRQASYSEVWKWHQKGLSNMEISRRTGESESTVRNIIKKKGVFQESSVNATADALKDQVDEKGYLNVGRGTENLLGVSRTKISTALKVLEKQGYTVCNVQTEQLGAPGQNTTIQVLAKKGSTYRDIVTNHMGDIKPVSDVTIRVKDDGTSEVKKMHPPKSIDSSRVYIRYAEDGGIDKDGTIELRRGVEDLDLGHSRYAQVRVAVDGKYYLKGMAFNSDFKDIPDGYDIIYNVNKKRGTPPEKVFKAMADDPSNPFGALIDRQNDYTDASGKEHQGALNIVREEGSWMDWNDNLPAQMLSKQSLPLAKQQLNLDYRNKLDNYAEIKSLTNPVVKQEMLIKFAESCDSSAVHLKAAALPRQAYHVLIPLTDIKDNEIYAPNYENGEKVVLIRFPHGGIFEIPELVVNNNRSKQAKDSIPNAVDAIGISSKVAERLSGADFDGDTALVIPNRDGRIQSSSPLQGLKDFDSKSYKFDPDFPHPKVGDKKKDGGDGFNEQRQMGEVSNLITDMTLRGASPEELARAVRHSMVVIDAIKHDLNWKQSEADNDIAELKKLYQNGGGASTLISKAKGRTDVPKRGYAKINPETGELEYAEPKKAYKYNKKTGEYERRTQRSTKMAEAKDARELLSKEKLPMEKEYAKYANQCKVLANEARKAAVNITMPQVNKEASVKYSREVASLKVKLNDAKKASVFERQAQLLGGEKLKTWREDNPHADNDEVKKQKGRMIVRARQELGYDRYRVTFTPKEWEAIQNNAISPTMLRDLLKNADMDEVSKLALPRETRGLSPAKKSRIKAYAASGYTQAEIAEAMGLTEGQVSGVLKDV